MWFMAGTRTAEGVQVLMVLPEVVSTRVVTWVVACTESLNCLLPD